MKKHPLLYSGLLILLIWTFFYILLSKSFMPSPLETLAYVFHHFTLLMSHLLVSFYRIGISILITVILGGSLGILIAQNKKVDQFLSPLIYTLYPIPKIAFLPLIMLFFGLGNLSKIILISLILFFQITLSVRDSVKNIHPSYYLSIKSLGAGKRDLYRHVILPAMLPNLFTALRVSVGTAISVLFFAENFATRFGIGYFIMDSWLKLDYVAMFAGIIAISLMGRFIFSTIDYLERKYCAWSR
ncbi:MAG: ABC transporter permease [Vallitaleaceae bacterium]|jgi:NitT/TauT family transport system permease protein|nr:ABC transporter permease [Vallitaleaceae bacterium]